MKSLLIGLTILLFGFNTFGQQLNTETKEKKQERMEWWQDARFGMFIHWGLYALPARHEWVMSNEKMSREKYEKYAEYFNPDLYNPTEWAKMAKNAGMKYVVFTAKHHDGFCMYDSKFTDYKVTNSPIGKDVMRELVDAFRAEGIRIGLYYSLIDWHHQDFTVKDPIHPLRNNKEEIKKDKKRDKTKYQAYLKNQLTEILSNYGQIDVLFTDFSYAQKENGKGKEYWDSENVYKLIRKLQPQIIINDRLDLKEEKGWDFLSPEQFMPKEWVTYKGEKTPWETCQTFSGSWGYHRDEYTWKSPHQTIVMLIETVSKGGNLILNVGPTGRGVIQKEAEDRLAQTGEWMKFHSRSIYNCTAAPEGIETPDNCLLTYNPETNRLYVHVLEWPFKTIYLPGLKDKIEYAQLLNDASELKLKYTKGAWLDDATEGDTGIKIQLPVQKPDVEVPVIEIFLKDKI
ncbi:alpha-L-fucosidase [Flammeovirga pectinis]|uniref:alpha-L-fucosidase n=1 Tax=Flammeovirga pectinis TaxID=2494373 RepID=A0A3Q9FTB3_9BACT|nr:alpha-L-fucosidase [Flammeovirga pectinis]AZQ63982.1 alpha-L-fucosidase [Flammeovirga pectinis]